jgi:putative membrane protein
MPDRFPSESTQLAHDRTGLAHEQTDLAGERTDLAIERTVLAHERTLMAWVRTSTSLIAFGFTIYKFFDYMKDQRATAGAADWLGPREFALAMISTGLVAVILASVEHRRSLNALEAAGGRPRRSLALVMAVLVAGLGVLGFLLALFKQ